jgi:anti-sigma factor RsiW
MVCNRSALPLSLMLDGALGPLGRLRLTWHTARCDDCAARLEELRTMQEAMRTWLPYHRAPPRLATHIGAALPREAPPLHSPPRFRLPAFSMAGTGLAGGLAGVVLTVLAMGGQNGGQGDAMQSVISSHIRSIQANHLIDVATSDQHTVKPWLSARLNVSPPVRDLRDDGFPLVGGRLDYVGDHPAAAVVYQRAKHVINLFAWAADAKPDRSFHVETKQGFNIVTWRRNGLTFYAVSDVEVGQLTEFARLIAAG